jgi:beta-lactamase superfamily II metal-dependent hydrolase
MVFELRILQADHGDSIAIKIEHEGEIKNILIDGGPASVFECNSQPMALKEFLDEIINADEFIDLLILTHVDDDHVGGLLAGFEQSEYLEKLTKKVWFNSGQLIFDHFKTKAIESNSKYLEFNPESVDKITSIAQGVEFETHIKKLACWTNKLIQANEVIELFGCIFKILSPTEDKLNKLLFKWENEIDDILTSPYENDYSNTFHELIRKDKFKGDQSPHNGSSIAFLFEHKGQSILFLGDSHAPVIINSLKNLNYSKDNKLKLDYMKVSHHGSKANTNKKLLELIDCKNFIISTDGSRHNLPNKVTLARIIEQFPDANFLFNYPDLKHHIFKNDELLNSTFSVLSCEDIIEL